MVKQPYDAVLVLSFGGPEGMDDVIPFLRNVLRGKNVPEDRMLEVAGHYEQFGGVSPINAQNRALIRALEIEMQDHGISLPVYWGNRNWHPFLSDSLRRMKDDGIRSVLAFVTSAYGSYSGCRQYLEDIDRAREEVGVGAPRVHKLRRFYNHPLFIQANAEEVGAAVKGQSFDPSTARLIFTAHSIPVAMAESCDYQQELLETCRLVAEEVGVQRWKLVYQSRSGPPHQPWLEPDICDHLSGLKEQGVLSAVIVPIGFLSDHLEVLYDLDTEARHACEAGGIKMTRVPTVGTRPAFIQMIRELIEERMRPGARRRAVGRYSAAADECAENCCTPLVASGRGESMSGRDRS